jgi:hypothetical protein
LFVEGQARPCIIRIFYTDGTSQDFYEEEGAMAIERLRADAAELQRYQAALTMPGGHVTAPDGIAKLLENAGSLCAANARLTAELDALAKDRKQALQQVEKYRTLYECAEEQNAQLVSRARL